MADVSLIGIAFLTSSLAATVGMGGGILLLACMPGLLPVQAIIPLHAVTQFASNVSRAGFSWPHFDWRIVPPFAAGALLGAAVGGSVYQSLDLVYLPALIGLFILLITWLPLPQVRGTGASALGLLGFYQTGLGMVAGATGPLGAAVLAHRYKDRDALVVNTAVYMSINHGLRILAFGVLGFAFAPWWQLLLGMVLASIAGSWCGTKLRARIPRQNFHLLFKVLLSGLAVRMMLLPFLPDL